MPNESNMELTFLEPTKITINPITKRLRTDMGDIAELADSIKRTRQIMPIAINRKNELIDGGRRLTACILLGIKVFCVYQDTIDAYEMKELEIEANLHGKKFTPAEYDLGVKELHDMKRHRLGETTPGKKGGWTLDDTAKITGKTRGSVIASLDRAALVEAFPELRNAKKKSEITKAGKALRKLEEVMNNVSKHEEALKQHKDLFTLVKQDALRHMTAMENASVDILLTDPIYGIDAATIAQGIGGKTGGITSAGYQIDDSIDKALFYYAVLAKESIRFCKSNAHGYIFHAPEHFNTVRQLFLDSGWRVHVKPIIWTKRETGQCNVPASWPASCYENVMYIRRDESRIVKEGQPDWIQCDPVVESKRLHPYEKPVPLLSNLLNRVATPGSVVYDPFVGSGSSLEAALIHKCFAIGCELEMEPYASALKRMNDVVEKL